ncbi:outer membrane lipoprotein LolB [Ahniella affigens]|uniref:Outer-membrane lipoprotein LolB n=1 Tax=Ahniella affigens TaxID=2021234 RepID=A0A2P1PRQ5_9GAMM|nr:lipoprotein insertase outer membrane protein LolB [Ahniella affigens]AVP97521.1 outer membrane lipoprotein LolB [Ahniella affigens]
MVCKRWRVLALPLVALTLVALLASCASQSTRDLPPSDAADVAPAPVIVPTHWQLSGKIALSNGQDSGSGRLEWQQDGDFFNMSLRSPISGQSWQLLGGPEGCALEGFKPEPVMASTPEELVRRELGWELPVGSLKGWLFGQIEPSATTRYDANGRVLEHTDDGWTITYRDWREQQGHWLPGKVFAKKKPYQVRLAIQTWNLDEPSPDNANQP